MIFDSPEAVVADQYFSFVNNVIGVVGVSFAATAMQFDTLEPFAWVFFIVIFFWAFSEGGRYRKVAGAYKKKYGTILGTLRLAWRLKVFMFGNLVLLLVAFGVLTKDAVAVAWSL